jgi:FG-GAP-like repeat
LPEKSIAAADFDGDGTIDLAIVSHLLLDALGGEVSVLFNSGDARFTPRIFSTDPPLLDVSQYSAGEAPWALVAADLNGDGATDLAVASFGAADAGGSVTVLLNNGNGDFISPANSFGAGTNPASIVAADFNADGATDLAVGNFASHGVSLLLNQGNGLFTSTPEYAVGTAVQSVTAADLNADGLPWATAISARRSHTPRQQDRRHCRRPI